MFNKLKGMFSAAPPKPLLSNLVALACFDEFGRAEISQNYLTRCYRTQRALLAMFGDMPLADFTPRHYVHFHDSLNDRKRREITVNTYRRRLQALFNRLYKRRHVSFDPVPLTTYIKTGKPPVKYTQASVLQKLMSRCCLRDHAMIMLALRSGIRRQTLRKLLVSDIVIWQNDDRQYRFAARIPAEKSSAPRVIFAGHDAAILIKAWLDTRQFDSPYLFNQLDKPIALTDGAIKEIWRSNAARANLTHALHGAAWHRLRHTFARSQLSAGHDIRTVADWMGIAPDTLVSVYATNTDDLLASAYFDGEDIPAEVLAAMHSGGNIG